MTYYNPAAAGLRPLTGDEYLMAWADYKRACKEAYYRGSIGTNAHIFWLLATVFTFGVAGIGWIIHGLVGKPTLRPGMYAPQWPPPGYYIPQGRR